MRDLASHAAGTGDAVRRKARGDEETAHLRLAQDEFVVRRERLRAVDQLLDAGIGHGRHAPHCARRDLLEARPVGRQQLSVEVRRDAVQRPGRWVALVAAHHQAAHLRPEIDEVVGVAKLGKLRDDAGHGLGDEVLVRHWHDRDGDAGHATHFRRSHTRGIDHDLGLDCTSIGLDSGDMATLHAQPDDAHMRQDGRSPLARPRRHRPRQAARVEPSIGRQPGGAQHTVGAHQREPGLCLLCADQLHRQAVRLGPPCLASQLLEAFRR